MSDMTDDIETLRRGNERLQVALAEANAVREACAQRAFRLEAEVERLREELRQSGIDHTRAEVERLREEVERLREDAERYRWVRDHALAIDLAADPDNFVQAWVGTDPARVFRGKTLDDAIDEAMKQAALRREDV